MKPNGLLIAVGVLAVLGAGIFYSNKKQAAKVKTEGVAIVSIPEDQMQEIRLQKAGQVVDLKKTGGKWALTQPQAVPADPDAASTLCSAFSKINASDTIEDNATDLAAFGLDKPTLDAQVTTKDGKTVTLLLGDDTPVNTGSYAKVAGNPHVYTVSSAVKTTIDKTTDDLRDKRLMTFDSDKLTRVELTAKGPPIEFGKNGKNEWEIVKPRPLRADGLTVYTLVSNLKDAKMDLSVTPEEAAKKFAGAAKTATATVTDSAASQTLEVRKDKDNNYYAKSSVLPGVYKMVSAFGDGLNKSVDDFRNKKLYDFSFSDPVKLEITGVTYTKTGDKWMLGSKIMDNGSVQDLIDKLRDLTATGFADKGGGQPVFDALVVSDTGKRTEKVIVTKQGDKYFAQREGEPSIYVLDVKTVDDLQKTASSIKEAPPQPPTPAKKK